MYIFMGNYIFNRRIYSSGQHKVEKKKGNGLSLLWKIVNVYEWVWFTIIGPLFLNPLKS